MRMTNRVLSLLLMLALAVPAVAAPGTAFAQSAGDDQYVDPFQDDESGGGNQGNSGSQSDDTPAAEEPVAQAPADTGDTAGSAAEEAADGPTLPRTGFPAGEFALIGVILLGGGFALRRAWPRPG
jgi:LPXTG-motif cell wall-anchored protein